MLSILYLNKVRKGFSLVELIIIISILGILTSMSIHVFEGYSEKAKERICRANCSQMARLYEGYLVMGRINHSDLTFAMYTQDYVKDVCPDKGQIIYFNGNVSCLIHTLIDGNNGEVPYL